VPRLLRGRTSRRPSWTGPTLCVPCTLCVLCILCVLRTVSAQEPCAACIVLAITPSEVQTPTIDVPIAVVIPANADDEMVAAALSTVARARAIAVIVDAREDPVLTDQGEYRLRIIATAVRAERDTVVGIELRSSQ